MIPAIFDRGWVHPWRRPAEEGRVVRLSEPLAPVYDYRPLPEFVTTAAGLGRAEPRADAVVFGPSGSGELQAPREHIPAMHCPCGTSQALESDAACWNCGRSA